MATCKDCGKQLGAFEKKYPVREAGVRGVICAACRQKPRVCSGCGGQIDRLKKHRVLKDGSFLCEACYEERKKKQAQEQVQVTQREEDFSAGYKGGFGGVPKEQIVSIIIGPTQVTVESTAFLAQNRKVLWTMPYHKIGDIRVDTAEKITATRLLLTGVFAFALKKKERYLVIPFEDEHGMIQTPVFQSLWMNQIYQAVYERVGAARAQFIAQQAQTAQAPTIDVTTEAQTAVPTIDVTAQAPQAPTIDVTEQIKKLGELRDQGLLTEEEFDIKKKELLARM